MNFTSYFVLSTLVVAGIVAHAYVAHEQFYPAVDQTQGKLDSPQNLVQHVMCTVHAASRMVIHKCW